MNISPISNQIQFNQINNIDNKNTSELPREFIQRLFQTVGQNDTNSMKLVCQTWKQISKAAETTDEDSCDSIDYAYFLDKPVPYSNPMLDNIDFEELRRFPQFRLQENILQEPTFEFMSIDTAALCGQDLTFEDFHFEPTDFMNDINIDFSYLDSSSSEESSSS